MDANLADGMLREFSPENRSKAPPRSEVYQLVGDTAEAIADVLREELRTLRKRVEFLEAREEAFKGVHQRALAYSKGDFVTHGGNLWIALKEVPAGKVPGVGPEFWQLAAKAK